MNKKLQDIAYIDIFKKAFDITWKNRALWWFGLLLALGGGMGNMNYAFDEKNKNSSERATQFISDHLGLVITGAIILTVIFLMFVVLSIIARGGIIESIEKVLKNKPFEFRSGMREGKKYFWKIFLLGIILCLLMIASIVILATPVIFLFIAKSYILGVMLAIFAVLIFIPIVILVTYIKTYGEIYIVSGKLSSWNAIETSYELFRKNLATSLIMGILFIPVGIILMIAMMILIAPLAVLAVAFAFLGKIGIAVTVIIGLAICIIILLIQSVFQVFHQTAWLLFFHEIATPIVEEKIEEPIEEVEKEILPTVDPVKTAEIEK
ncbi:MAG: hypothetical protein WCV59_01595 [Parcubacteria group bacterium]|jgi:hypothetical protein